jgi:DNA-binding IclR family transcriptional regulator
LGGFSPLECHLVEALAPHDYDGGLSYRDWVARAKVSQAIFDQALQSLRRKGVVFQSTMNGRYQLSPRFAAALQKAKRSASMS